MRYVIGAAALAAIVSSACGQTVHFSNGRDIWTSTDAGASFAKLGAVTSVSDRHVLGDFGVVGLGYHAGLNSYFASGSNGHLYTVTGLGTANVALSFYKDLGSSTISFEFVGDDFVGVRGNDLVAFDVVANGALHVINTNTGLSSVPSTALVDDGYYGIIENGRLYRINNAGAATLIGNTGTGGLHQAGGSGLNNVYYHGAGYQLAGDDVVRFGTVNTQTAAFTLLSETNIGTAKGQMGLVVVVPAPSAGAAMTLGGLFVARRRRR
ncbi:MAG: PEP-CTERM sorting domain-containing protein [Phycisphaerales bacterium]|jgi:hypothetical protein|nr:PEP-CTERM sorting domain-containing protein [Phycisphaerales bacterium]